MQTCTVSDAYRPSPAMVIYPFTAEFRHSFLAIAGMPGQDANTRLMGSFLSKVQGRMGSPDDTCE